MKQDTNFVIGIAALLSLGLAGYAVFKSGDKAAGSSLVRPAPAFSSERVPYPGGAEGSGNIGDQGAREGFGETATENLYAVIPETEHPIIGGDDSRYVQRHVSELTGWSQQDYLNRYKQIYGEVVGGPGSGVPYAELTKKDLLAFDYVKTPDQADYVTARNQLIAELGGTWENGVLTPPPDYQARGISVTQFSDMMREHLLKAGYSQE